GADGVLLNNVKNTTVGGAGRKENWIVSNAGNGVHVYGPRAIGNIIDGNIIGTDGFSAAGKGNDKSGVLLDGGSAQTSIGLSNGAGNIISGNGKASGTLGNDGVTIKDSGFNTIQNNWIGLSVDGGFALANKNNGISIIGKSPGNRIGATFIPGGINL